MPSLRECQLCSGRVLQLVALSAIDFTFQEAPSSSPFVNQDLPHHRPFSSRLTMSKHILCAWESATIIMLEHEELPTLPLSFHWDCNILHPSTRYVS